MRKERRRHLRLPLLALDEHDGDLLDAEPVQPRAVRRLDLERVPVGPDVGKVDRLQHLAPVAAKPRRQIRDRRHPCRHRPLTTWALGLLSGGPGDPARHQRNQR